MLFELPVFVAIFARYADSAGRFVDQHARGRRRHNAIRRTGRNNEIIVRAIIELAELTGDRAGAGMDEEQFVAADVAIEVLHRLIGLRDRDQDVGIAQSGVRDSIASRPCTAMSLVLK